MRQSRSQYQVDLHDRKKAAEFSSVIVDFSRRHGGVTDEVMLGKIREIAREVVEGSIKYGRRLERERIARSLR